MVEYDEMQNRDVGGKEVCAQPFPTCHFLLQPLPQLLFFDLVGRPKRNLTEIYTVILSCSYCTNHFVELQGNR